LLCYIGVGKSLKDGPTHFPREARDAVWQSHFQELVQFKKVGGYRGLLAFFVSVAFFNRPGVSELLFQQPKRKKKHRSMSESKHKATHLRLAQWCHMQRAHFQNRSLLPHEKPRRRGKGGYMTDDQLQQLASIGFRVSNVHLKFNDRLAHLQEYKQLHGHTFVPHAYTGFSNL
jgi:Helicase associated domain